MLPLLSLSLFFSSLLGGGVSDCVTIVWHVTSYIYISHSHQESLFSFSSFFFFSPSLLLLLFFFLGELGGVSMYTTNVMNTLYKKLSCAIQNGYGITF